MPVYAFQHPKTKEIIEVVQGMKENHTYTDEEGVQWERVWTSPNASIDTNLDGSKESFMKYTQNKKGATLGDLWDTSRRCSEMREREQGKDNIKDKYFNNYSKRRRGKKHQHDPKNAKKNMKYFE